VKSTDYEIPHYSMFSNLLFLILSQVQIFPQQPVLTHPQSKFFLGVRHQVLHTYKATSKTIYLNE